MDKKTEIDTLFAQAIKGYDDPTKLEFYEPVKTERIIELLLEDEEFTLNYLQTATKDFFYLIFIEDNLTAELLLKKFPDERMQSQLEKLCTDYLDDQNAEGVKEILSLIKAARAK